jgi:glycosyltransferase involved in cell wall biosynthesis
MTLTQSAIDPEDATASEAPASLPQVSIIIPVKNDVGRLKICLKSLKAQDYPGDGFEIIVVDNGSADESATVAAKMGAKVLCHPERRIGALRNQGVAASSGSILAFVDADHELPPDWLANGVHALQSDSAICAAGAPCVAPPKGSWVQRYWQVHRLRVVDRQLVDWLGAGNLFVRRASFEQAGGFDEDLIAAEDVDLCLRLASQNGKILSDPAIRNIHHGEPKTLWQFFRKEYWRGSSGVRAFVRQGFPVRELPSLLYPAYYLLTAIGLILALGYAIRYGSATVILSALFLLVAPALLLAVNTCWRRRDSKALLPLAVLYLTYGLARAAALFKQ